MSEPYETTNIVNTNIESKEALMKKQYQHKLKTSVAKLFKQLSSGCDKKICYNTEFCKKAKDFDSTPYSNLSKQELLQFCYNKIKESDNIDSLVCIDFKSYEYKGTLVNSFEEWYYIFDTDSKNITNMLNINHDKAYISPKKIFSFYNDSCSNKSNNKDKGVYAEIQAFNSMIDSIVKDYLVEVLIDFKEKDNLKLSKHHSIIENNITMQNKLLLSEYLFKIYFNFINYLLLSNELIYHIFFKEDTYTFFENFFMLMSYIKKEKKFDIKQPPNEAYFTDLFSQFCEDKPKINNKLNCFSISEDNSNNSIVLFKNCISCFQNFLTVLVLDLTQDHSEVTNTDLKILIGILRTFEMYYIANKRYDLVDKSLFESEKVNNYLSLKSQCFSYFTYMQLRNNENMNIFDKEISNFSFIKYFFLYDSASKKDIISQYNSKIQANEVSSSFESIDALLGLQNIYLVFKVKRNDLIKSTLDIISGNLNFRKPLKIKFSGEQGVDEGGVKKEFFMLLIRQLFDPNYGMFCYDEKSRFFWFNLFSFESSLKYELIGILFGLAIFNDVLIDIKFPRVIYKKLLGEKCDLEDLKEMDEDMYRTLCFLRDTDQTNIEDTIGTNFEVEVENFGSKEVIELKPNGSNIPLTFENKQEYIDLYLDWKFNISVEKFYKPFYTGFYKVADKTIFEIIESDDLELIICGTQDLNFKDLEKGSMVTDGFTKESQTVKDFWEIVHEFDYSLKKKFLFFLSGCDRAPIKGLSSLRMVIGKHGPDSDSLPCAHTCFNYLLIPDYNNKEKLKGRLLLAIENSEGFGLI